MKQESMEQIPGQTLAPGHWMVLPIPPGRAEAWRRFVQDLQGLRQSEWAAWCERVGVSQLRLWLQSNQKETAALPYGRVRVGAERLFDDHSPFGRWLRAQVLAFHGVDIAQIGAGFKSELIIDIETELRNGFVSDGVLGKAAMTFPEAFTQSTVGW